MVIHSQWSTQTARVQKLLGRLVAALALPALLAACAPPGYYVQAAAGQYELMRQRQPIDELLADESIEADLLARLELAQDIHVFGVERLGLPDDGGYRQYAETGRDAVTWIVVAAPEFSLQPKTWCFLFAGCVPYRGYFARENARRFADTLRSRDYDVAVAPATAYSTLGWFDDPLLDTMFTHGPAQFAGTLFHEMAHLALYVKNATVFNESFASFVEETGVRLWLESIGDEAAYREWQDDRIRRNEIDRLFRLLRPELEALYTSDLSEDRMRESKQQAFDRLCAAVNEPGAPDRSSDSARCNLNNASFGLRQAYHGGRCAFQALYREANGDMVRFIELATERSRLPPESRDTWLSQPCRPVAPDGNL
jgi:predicted aminopeptidase